MADVYEVFEEHVFLRKTVYKCDERIHLAFVVLKHFIMPN